MAGARGTLDRGAAVGIAPPHAGDWAQAVRRSQIEAGGAVAEALGRSCDGLPVRLLELQLWLVEKKKELNGSGPFSMPHPT